ncbi:MAG TPA: nucleotidyltransferase family protein [Candidatus Methylomirabilis sp.]|nr:nucleotidyltransferase family protein [Candidatus Methylomirabilis sp.]
MKAMILAAGLGTRLRPLTNDRPKALVEINGRTLLEITIERLKNFGVCELIVNVHHFAEMVVAFLKSKSNFGLRIEVSREDDLLLDTGGGLKKASWFFLENSSALDEPFLLHNVDVISSIDFSRMLQFHNEHHALATLAVQVRESSRQLLFNQDLQLCGRRINNQETLIPAQQNETVPSRQHATNPQKSVISSEARNPSSPSSCSDSPLAARHSPLPLAFSGIHIVSTRLFPLLTEATPVFSIIDSYLRLASQGHKILAFRADSYYWRDLGRPEDLAQAALDLQQDPTLH